MLKSIAKTGKVAHEVIYQIREAILSDRLKPGDKLASEKELIAQFGVSKATMREALRVLETLGLIEIRSGVSGGAFVAKSSIDTACESIINFLHFQQVTVKEITMLRYMIEPHAAGIATIKRNTNDVHQLKKLLAAEAIDKNVTTLKENSFHCYLVRISGNPVLILNIEFIDNILGLIIAKSNPGKDFYRGVQEGHRIILECINQKDPMAAKIAMIQDILWVGNFLSQLSETDPFDPEDIGVDKTGTDTGIVPLPKMRVVSDQDPVLKSPGILMKRVGSGSVFLVMN